MWPWWKNNCGKQRQRQENLNRAPTATSTLRNAPFSFVLVLLLQDCMTDMSRSIRLLVIGERGVGRRFPTANVLTFVDTWHS